MHTSRRVLSTTACFLALATLTAAHTRAAAEDWWRFRGPNGAGISDAAGIPVQFGPGHNELWSADVPAVQAGADWQVLALNDLGAPIYASPALADGRIYVRTASRLYAFGHRRELDAAGLSRRHPCPAAATGGSELVDGTPIQVCDSIRAVGK